MCGTERRMKILASVFQLTSAGVLLLLAFSVMIPPVAASFLVDASIHKLEVLDRDGQPTTSITDGDLIQLRLTFENPVSAQMEVAFTLEGEKEPVSQCVISQDQDSCETSAFSSLGWHWNSAGQPQPERTLHAGGTGVVPFTTVLQVSARPVVMVHGFISSWEAWKNYLGADGFLDDNGIKGFAVGDDQADGVLNTGRLQAPKDRTNTIAENAAVLGEYIDGVKRLTGAQQVDLMAHSMGGLISRYYIDRVMQERDVAQLIMLGSPMAGTDCAVLPASLGLYLPASLEIRPEYVSGIFNQQITHRHGIAFHDLAGVPIVQPHKSPCTSVPTDLAVSLDSVKAIPLRVVETPILHTELNTSQQVYDEYVRPLLQLPPGSFPEHADPNEGLTEPPQLQFSRLYSGHLDTNSSQELTILIDPGVTVASFALYDTTRSLAVTVRGASGNVIELNSENNGLVVVEDPAALLYLGYGFEDPKPGAWNVTLSATQDTPPDGADYSLTAYFVGGAILDAGLSTILPQAGDTLQLEAQLTLGGQNLNLQQAQAQIRDPQGETQTIDVLIEGTSAVAEWETAQPGVYGLDISVSGFSPDGAVIERVSFLSYEVQPLPQPAVILPLVTGIILVCIAITGLIAVGAVFFLYSRSARRSD